jgi:hypothetical protein
MNEFSELEWLFHLINFGAKIGIPGSEPGW